MWIQALLTRMHRVNTRGNHNSSEQISPTELTRNTSHKWNLQHNKTTHHNSPILSQKPISQTPFFLSST